MTAIINGVTVTGTPEEIAKLMSLLKTTNVFSKPYTITGINKTQTKDKHIFFRTPMIDLQVLHDLH
jgi:hypothetical protein